MPKRFPRVRDRRGIALVLAMFALVVLGAIVAGTFFAGRLEQQSGENTLYATQAREAAEAGLTDALVTIDPAGTSGLAAGGPPLLLPPLSVGAGVSVERQVSRLTSTLFLLTARATRHDAGGGSLASGAAGLLVHLLPDSASGIPIVAPLRDRPWLQLY
jgi:hypothetical protein